MKFRTEIEIPPSPFRLKHGQKLMSLGSCFAENIGKRLMQSGFNLMLNPFGITYNPLSAAKIMELLLSDYIFCHEDIRHHNHLYFNLLFHGSHSQTNSDTFLAHIRQQTATAREQLPADCLLLTFGTAHVYEWAENGEVVNNCHKLPASYFIRRRLSVSEIVERWQALIRQLLTQNPHLRIILTVSPIRHWKDGAHGNQLSKSILLLAVEELCKLFDQNVIYFPSYEIVLDELRDYRFYVEDMLHPNNQAVEYCWQRFSQTFFDEGTQEIIRKWMKISRSLAHRPLHKSAEYHTFREKAEAERKAFVKLHPQVKTY